MSELALKLIAKEKKEKTGSLDLGNCGLTELLEELFELRHLERLVISNEYFDWRENKWVKSSNQGPENYIRGTIGQITRLKGLKQLIIGGLRLNGPILDIDILAELSQLQVLHFIHSQISDGRFLAKLTNLQVLGLGYNEISDIRFLEGLSNLQVLDLSKNQINEVSPLSKLINLRILDLGYNQIQDISHLSGLIKLQDLDLSDNQIEDVSHLSELINLQALNVDNNQVSEISHIAKLTELRYLNLSENQINDFSYLSKLRNLQTLDLSINGIEDISYLSELAELRNLHLGGNHISDVSYLAELSGLHDLDLGSNGISDISYLAELSGLQNLNLGHNEITDISHLSELTGLQTLVLLDNGISNISHLRELTGLQKLDLSTNQIEDISYLSKLTELQVLDLAFNRIRSIYSLSGLVKLQVLLFHQNRISNISALGALTKNTLIRRLGLSNNEITDLTPILPLIKRGLVIKWDYQANGISVENNPLKTPPPEIIKEGNEAVLKYFKDLEKQGVDYLYEAKLLIVGEGESGKTTLAWKLKNIGAELPKKGEDRTKGIDIQPLEIPNQEDSSKPFRMNVWDFGGQEIYHATHQFFLTKRSLYLLVNNTRSNLTDFNQWVQTINLFSNNSPILIVQNEVAGSVTDFDLRGLQQYFTNVLGLKDADLSNVEDGRVQKLIREIHHQIQQLDHVGMELPKQWVAIRKDLEVQAREKPFISNRNFSRICEQNGVAEKEAIQRIGDIFHDLGVLLYFQEDPILRKLMILQNSWATKGVYAILDDAKIREQKGRFSFDDADQIWEGTEFEGKEAELLQLMVKFELCYRIPFHDPPLYVSPQLLPKEKPHYQWDNQQNLILYYRYEFMPKGLLGRLIVRLHRYIKDIDQYAWRTGCIFTYEDTDAQVIETYGASRIEIRINGKHCSRIATIITKEIDELNDSFERIEVKKLIPCNCSDCLKLDTPNFYDYEDLMKRKEKGKRTVECSNSYEDVVVLEILEGVFESIPEHEKNIAAFVKMDDIEEAINLLESTHRREAMLLHQRLTSGKRYFALGLMTSEDWSVLRQQIGNSILTISEMPASKVSDPVSPTSQVDKQLDKIEAKLSVQDQLLNRIVEQNDSHQQEMLAVLQDFAAQPPDEAYIEELVAVIERGMADLQANVPQSSEIGQKWLEASKQLQLAADSKAKLKWTIPFLFFNIEKEFSWNGKDWFRAIREDVKRGVKGDWREMFLAEN